MSGRPDAQPEDFHIGQIDARTLLALLRLRVDVFVVEQGCPYPEIDGRDDEPGTRHIWFEGDGGTGPVAYLRLLDDGVERRIGRVVTDPAHRGAGWAARLVDHALRTAPGPWVLDAQAHLEEWYGRFGFERAGDTYVEDGIPHVTMRRPR